MFEIIINTHPFVLFLAIVTFYGFMATIGFVLIRFTNLK